MNFLMRLIGMGAATVGEKLWAQHGDKIIRKWL